MISGYRAPSLLGSGGDEGSDLTLETALGATPLGYIANPQFFSGFLARPDVVAASLLAVADIAGARYADLSALRALSNDPVVTASGDRLRFESFSADNGVYTRLDLLSDGIESGAVSFGTTNVDINPPLRNSLARLGRTDLVHVEVGADALELSTIDKHHIEREVAMPDRWVRGFAEIPGAAEEMTVRGAISGGRIAAFLGGLPKGTPGPSVHLVVGPAGILQSLRSMPGSVHLAGTARLSAASRIARFASNLTLYGGDSGASGWVFDLPGARLTLLLSPDPYRGFSGEGALLGDLKYATSIGLADTVAGLLAWEPVIDIDLIGADTGRSRQEVRTAISELATSGKVGFDLAEQEWFHRELPLDPTRVLRDNPRLVAARALVNTSSVSRNGGSWVVKLEGHVHYVDRPQTDLRCSCLWWAKYRGGRGPCSHILAVEIIEARGR